MRSLVARHRPIRQNLLNIVGLCLCFYFSYHIVSGERSILRLVSLEHKIEKTSDQYEGLREEREALEHKVVKLRPGSLDRDLLEERVRYVLGYSRKDEQMIILAPN